MEAVRIRAAGGEALGESDAGNSHVRNKVSVVDWEKRGEAGGGFVYHQNQNADSILRPGLAALPQQIVILLLGGGLPLGAEFSAVLPREQAAAGGIRDLANPILHRTAKASRVALHQLVLG